MRPALLLKKSLLKVTPSSSRHLLMMTIIGISIFFLCGLKGCSKGCSIAEPVILKHRFSVSPEFGTFSVEVSGRGFLECKSEAIASTPPRFNGTLKYIIEEGTSVQPGDVLFKVSTEKLERSARQFATRAARQEIAYEKAVVNNSQALVDREEELRSAIVRLDNAKAKEKFFALGTELLEIERSIIELQSATVSIKYFDDRLKTRRSLADKGYSSKLELLKTEDLSEQAKLRKLKAGSILSRHRAGKTNAEREKLRKTTERLKVTKSELKDRNERQAKIDKLSEERELLKTKSLEAAAAKRFDILKGATVTATTTGTAIYLSLRNYGIPKLREGISIWQGMSLIKVADTRALEAKVKIAAGEIEQIRTGQPARVSFPAIPNVICEGFVSKVGKVAVADKFMGKDGIKRFDVTVTIKEKHPRLVPNLSAKVQIEVNKLTNVQRLPFMCVYEDKNLKYVDIEHNGIPQKIKLTVIERDQGYCYFKKTLPETCNVFLPKSGAN